jgi:hypothetical protein
MMDFREYYENNQQFFPDCFKISKRYCKIEQFGTMKINESSTVNYNAEQEIETDDYYDYIKSRSKEVIVTRSTCEFIRRGKGNVKNVDDPALSVYYDLFKTPCSSKQNDENSFDTSGKMETDQELLDNEELEKKSCQLTEISNTAEFNNLVNQAQCLLTEPSELNFSNSDFMKLLNETEIP